MKLCAPEPLTIDIFSGDPQSQSLFDFEIDRAYLQHSKMLLPINSSIIHPQGGFPTFQTGLQKPEQSKQLFGINMDIFVDSEMLVRKLTSEQRYLYKVVGNDGTDQIQKGDVIKIGLFEMIVKEINLQNSEKPKQEVFKQTFTPNGSVLSLDQSHNKRCRICLDALQTQDDPLICLCRCAGTVKYTHLSCMRVWYSKFLEKQESQVCTYYRFSKGICDVCKSPLPLRFPINNKEVTLGTYQTHNNPHVVLELIEGSDSDELEIIILKLNTKSVTIGTSMEADLCFIDNIIDNIHCEIELRNDKLYIADKKTQFGTLLRVKRNFKFNGKQGIKLQFESMLMEIKNEPCFLSWLCHTNNYILVYEQYNSNKGSEISRIQIQ